MHTRILYYMHTEHARRTVYYRTMHTILYLDCRALVLKAVRATPRPDHILYSATMLWWFDDNIYICIPIHIYIYIYMHIYIMYV